VEKEIEIEVNEHAVERYLEDHNLNEIELKVELETTLVSSEEEGETKGKGKGKGKGKENSDSYHLSFTLSPPGCYFDNPLKLKIKGKYKKSGYTLSMLGYTGSEVGFAHNKDHSDGTAEIYDFGEADESYDEWFFWAASYSSSVVVKIGKGGELDINPEAYLKIKSKSVDDYLKEMGIKSVEITVEMYYGWDREIWFVFGPSGTFFTPKELELTILGGYIEEDMLLLGEDGEFLEYTVDKKQQSLTFFIPHFSSYSYEDYDY